MKPLHYMLMAIDPSRILRTLNLHPDRWQREVLLSQEKMLRRLDRTPAPSEEMKAAYVLHLERLHEWLGRQRNLAVLRVPYNDLVERPREQAERVRGFLGGLVHIDGMVKAVDPSLYRNRKAAGESTERG